MRLSVNTPFDYIRNVRISAAAALICILAVILFGEAGAASLVYLDAPGEDTYQERQVRAASAYYGLAFEKHTVRHGGKGAIIQEAQRSGNVVMAVIHARCLPLLPRDELLEKIARYDKQGRKTPILILGIDGSTNRKALQQWSGDAVEFVSTITPAAGALHYADLPRINQTLSDQEIPVTVDVLSYLRLSEGGARLLSFKKRESDESLCLMIMENAVGRTIFFLSDYRVDQTSLDHGERRYRQVAETLPIMVFMRYTCGAFCWHGPGYFANLTIDDPFLVEPYGNLSYAGLLEEMKRIGFHTTIAYIPWNYNKSRSEAVDIVRNHSAWYSVSMHGNDHGFNEFQQEGKKEVHREKLEIAIARMETFRESTGIDYDRVMIFPTDPGPQETIELLKRYNFLGTANWTNVPAGRVSNPENLHLLKESVYQDAEGVPLLKRYDPAVPDVRIAMTLFAQLPVLFQAHQHDFGAGTGWFNATAARINRLCPGIEWVSLGTIFRNLYWKKQADEHHWDVRTFSGNIVIANPGSTTVKYRVRKTDDLSIPIKRVLVQGTEHEYEASENELILEVAVPPGETRSVIVEYQNDLITDRVDLSKIDLVSRLVRRLAEFRDVNLSNTSVGRLLAPIIYAKGGKKEFAAYTVLALFGLLAMVILIRRYKGGAK